MDTKKLPPALLMALGLSGCGGDDDGTATTGPCLDVAPMTSSATETGSEGGTAETTTGPCLFAPMSTSSESSGSDSGSGSGSESGSGDGTTLGPCLDAPPPTSTSGSESGDGSTGPMGADDRDQVVRSLVGRGILPDDVAARLGNK